MFIKTGLLVLVEQPKQMVALRPPPVAERSLRLHSSKLFLFYANNSYFFEKIEKIYLFKKIPLYKIKRKGSVRTDYLFGVLPIVRRKKKYRETNESILLDKIGDVNNTLADLLQNACSVTQHQIEKQAIFI